ncbi:MAG: hypothetical protein HYY18_01960 [Planctomycetes bacterium]|nr:hypothetical protein [Planctomycetota bacterium]
MKPLLLRVALYGLGPPVALLVLFGALVLWAGAESHDDLTAKLPDGLDAVARLERVSDAADFLEKAIGADASELRRRAWYGHFDGAAAGVRGTDVIAVVECPRLAALGPIELAAADALGLRKTAGGAYELAGRRFYMSSRGRLLYFATSLDLLMQGLGAADRDAPAAPAAAAVEIRDAGLVDRIDRARAAGKMNDFERFLHGRLRAVLEPRGRVEGRFTENGLELVGRARREFGPRDIAAKAVALRPVRPLRLESLRIPGLAWRQVETFSALHVWDEIFHDPDNRRFVGAFTREIEDYELFLGGRDFETDLLPKLGPERAFAVARIDFAAFGVRPKSPLPALLFLCECRGIEAEVLKSLDRFLTEAEKEGKSFDLPAPRGAVAPVLDPFSHVERTMDGVRFTQIVFREGVSEFGSEFSPGYAIIDGVLVVTTFWPLLPRISRGGHAGLGGHHAGRLDGAEARGILVENAGEVAEMAATWRLLDEIAPRAARDFEDACGRRTAPVTRRRLEAFAPQAAAEFERIYGTVNEPKDPLIARFTRLEDDLKLDRPDLRGDAFDLELDRRLEAWAAGERRRFALPLAEPEMKPPLCDAFAALESDLSHERPDLKGDAFDAELDQRLEGWIAGEKRACAAKRAEPLKKQRAFLEDVALRKSEFSKFVGMFRAVEAVEWAAESSAIDNAVRWKVRVRVR